MVHNVKKKTKKTLTPNGAHLQKLVKLDCPVLIDVDLLDHITDLVARHTLPEGLQNVTNLRNCYVTIAISIKLWVVSVCIYEET